MKVLLGYLSGIFTGIMISQGLIVLLGRTGFPGGEIFIIPLITILFALGWSMGKDYGYDRGFYEGSQEQKIKLVLSGR